LFIACIDILHPQVNLKLHLYLPGEALSWNVDSVINPFFCISSICTFACEKEGIVTDAEENVSTWKLLD
jgi:hypothetical protein